MDPIFNVWHALVVMSVGILIGVFLGATIVLLRCKPFDDAPRYRPD